MKNGGFYTGIVSETLLLLICGGNDYWLLITVHGRTAHLLCGNGRTMTGFGACQSLLCRYTFYAGTGRLPKGDSVAYQSFLQLLCFRFASDSVIKNRRRGGLRRDFSSLKMAKRWSEITVKMIEMLHYGYVRRLSRGRLL